MKNLFSLVSNRLMALFVLAALMWAAPLARAGLNVPYTPDANTLHLWHFNDPLSSDTEADLITNAPITLTNFGFPTNGPPFTNMGLASATVATGISEALQILPNDGNPSLGDSHAMAAGPEDMAATNFCNASSGAFTFEALVNPQGNIFSSSAGSGEWEIFCGDNSVGTRGWQFRLQNAAVPVMDFNFIDATGGNSINQTFILPTSGPDALVTNQWYHVAVTFTGNTPTNTDLPGILTFYWTLLDPNRTNADVLGSISNSALGTIGGTPSPAVGGSQRTVHGVGNEGAFQGMITEVRVSSVSRSATSFVFSTNSIGATPTFTREPAAGTFIGYGQTLIINALVSGSPTPALQWQQTNVSGGGWINIAGQNNNTLEISNATFAAATEYRLVASNYINGFPEVADSTVATVAIGAAFSEVFNTGCDANDVAGTNLMGDTDLHYTLSDSADASHPGPATAVWDMVAFPIAANGGGFANIDGVSQWIGPTWNAGGATYTSPQGSYVYRTHFLADSVDTTQPAAMRGTWWGNTTGANILLNGLSLNISTDVTNGGTISEPFVITNGFIPGLNTLDFVIPCVNPNGSYPEACARIEISSALGLALAPGLPIILTQPAANVTVTDDNIEPGGSATFSVVAQGRPPLSYQWVDQQAGPVAGATSRTLTFTNPTAGAQGTNFVVVIRNGSGSVTSSIAKLTIDETAQPPIAPNYSYEIYTNQTLNIDESLLLLASSDPNNLALTILLNPATNGSLNEVVANGTVYTYTPNTGFIGADGFTYTITDADGQSTNGTVIIDVVPPVLPTLRVGLSNHNFVFSGAGGSPGGAYIIISTTNLALPTTSWTTAATGNFNGAGAFSVSLPINATNAAQFYSLELP
jgi:hypothetical protein